SMHGLHHVFEHGIEEPARLLGITVGQQLHRALEVGEEHGDLLALTLERALRGKDLLGEVLGGVGRGRHEPDRNWGGCPCEPLPAFATKVIARRSRYAALWTRDAQLRSALWAKRGVSWRLPLTARTIHPSLSAARRSLTCP